MKPEISAFRQKVYATLKKIPAGKVTTYKSLAQAIGCKSCQAVGGALRHNPFAPQVPCHRVIASDLSPGGFRGKRKGGKLKEKIKLLEEEGVFFRNGKLADPARIIKSGTLSRT